MNKRKIMASLNNIANHLDNNGMFEEATQITKVMSRLAQYPPEDPPDDYYYDDKEDFSGEKFDKENFIILFDALKKLVGDDKLIDDLIKKYNVNTNQPLYTRVVPMLDNLANSIDENQTVFVNEKFGSLNFDDLASEILATVIDDENSYRYDEPEPDDDYDSSYDPEPSYFSGLYRD